MVASFRDKYWEIVDEWQLQAEIVYFRFSLNCMKDAP